MKRCAAISFGYLSIQNSELIISFLSYLVQAKTSSAMATESPNSIGSS